MLNTGVQIHGLPLGGFWWDNTLFIGSKIGEELLVDAINLHKPYLRVKVKFSIDIPLNPGFYIPRPGEVPLWV